MGLINRVREFKANWSLINVQISSVYINRMRLHSEKFNCAKTVVWREILYDKFLVNKTEVLSRGNFTLIYQRE